MPAAATLRKSRRLIEGRMRNPLSSPPVPTGLSPVCSSGGLPSQGQIAVRRSASQRIQRRVAECTFAGERTLRSGPAAPIGPMGLWVPGALAIQRGSRHVPRADEAYRSRGARCQAKPRRCREGRPPGPASGRACQTGVGSSPDARGITPIRENRLTAKAPRRAAKYQLNGRTAKDTSRYLGVRASRDLLSHENPGVLGAMAVQEFRFGASPASRSRQSLPSAPAW